MRYITFGGVGFEKAMSSVLKVPRQCPLVLVVRVKHMIGIQNLNLWR
jgi:hypothetical protein